MSLTAEEIRECTMIALDQPPFWPLEDDSFLFTVTVDGSSARPMTVRFTSVGSDNLFIYVGGKISWGDGTIDEYDVIASSILSHTYSSVGSYKIKIEHIMYNRSVPGYWDSHRLLRNQAQLDSVDSKFPIPEEYYAEYDQEEGKWVYKWRPADPTIVTYFNGVFAGCTNLISIPKKLFINFPKTNSVHRMFLDCHSLEELPNDIFSYFENVEGNAEWCFSGCWALEKLPNMLFNNFRDVVTFEDCFSDCRSLTSIPNNLFGACSLVTTFDMCFSRCESLTSIPSGLFDNCTSVTDFSDCFSGCSSLTSIPSGLFDNCSLVTMFISCFSDCTALEEIPSGLFDNCSLVTTFNSCFNGCESLTSIPSGLFDNCISVTNFSGCFYGCHSLTSIPSGLFDNCEYATDFTACFDYCRSITYVPSDLFDNCRSANRFNYCFADCTSIVSSVPDLWVTHESASHISCYYGCDNAANWEDIPAGWKSFSSGPI